MEPRARVSVWPGRRRVPGIVAPDSWGARGAECLPRDVLRRSSPATSPCDGTTVRRCLCHGTGPAPRKHALPQAVYPRRLMGVWGFYRATRPIPGRIFGAAEASPRVAPAEGRCAGAGSWTRGNLAARHAACARVVEQSDKNGWQKLDEPQPGQVHPRLIGPAAVGARMSSGEPTWRCSLPGCRRAPGPCRSRS